MKKIVYSIIALVTLFVTSCSNEDIEIQSKAQEQSVTCIINVLDLYENFNMTDNLTDNFLRDKSGAIGIFAYLYDNNGNAVDSIKTTTFTTNAVTLTFENVEGSIEGSKYTLIAIETLVDPDDNNLSDSWRIINSKKVSTLAIQQIDAHATPYDAVGAATVTPIIVTNKDLSLNVTPSPLGSRINFCAFNVDNLNAARIGYGTTDILDLYKMDPSMRDEDRYIIDLSQKDKFFLRNSLTKENFQNGYYAWSFVIENVIKWSPCFQTESQSQTGMWTVLTESSVQMQKGATYYAVFYYLDKLGRYAKGMFNSYEEMQSFVTRCEQENVSPISGALYDKPYTQWSVGTVSAVKSFMSGFSMVSDISRADDGTYNMMYSTSDQSVYYLYLFKNSTSGLNGILYVNYYDQSAYSSNAPQKAKAVQAIKNRVEKSVPSNLFRQATKTVTIQAVSDNFKRSSLLMGKKQ